MKNSWISPKLETKVAICWTASILVVIALEGILCWKVMKDESLAYVQQSIGDTTTLLAAHYRGEFNNLMQHIGEFQERLRQQVGETPLGEEVDLGSVSSLLEMSPAILDISLWRRTDAVGVFDLYQEPKRAALALNNRYSRFAEDYLQQLRAVESTEKVLVAPAFQGHSILSTAPTPLKEKNVAIFAIPFGEGDHVEVLVAHIRLDRFQTALLREGMVLAILVDDFGSVLAHPDPRNVNNLRVHETPLFQQMHASKTVNGQFSFSDAQGKHYLGGYSKIEIGKLSILTSLLEDEAASGIKVLLKYLSIFACFCIVSCVSFIYFFSARFKKLLAVESVPATTDTPSSSLSENEPKKPERWTVNNGSQIVGPLSAPEIATLLFAQELDFDSECWAEGTGDSAQIRTAKIFTGIDDASATLWVFDGVTVHGPITPGFLKTALSRGAFSHDIYICENTTVAGWEPLKKWDPTFATSSATPGVIPLPVPVTKPNVADSEAEPQEKKAV